MFAEFVKQQGEAATSPGTTVSPPLQVSRKRHTPSTSKPLSAHGALLLEQR